MRNFALTIAVLLVLAGCSAGGSNNTAFVSGDGTTTVLSVDQRG